jgi:hypothetical protein
MDDEAPHSSVECLIHYHPHPTRTGELEKAEVKAPHRYRSAGPRHHRRSPFAYDPLDHHVASIRLIRISEHLSPGGHVQCEIRNASVNDAYICLSYVWGEEDRGHHITINGKSFRVRKNLHYFLRMARHRQRLLQEWFWIDALCIDQSNVNERNHQVQQMGLIYSRATEVISWLGNDKVIAVFLESMSKGESLHYLDGPYAYRFYSSEYWNRAWITQEVALGRLVVLRAGAAKLDASLLELENRDYMSRIASLSPKNTHTLRGRSLIYLMELFKLKESRIPRDRVYSLLALCGDGSELQVDYNKPHELLAQDILRCCEQSFCLCSIRTVAFVLQLKSSELDLHVLGEESFAYINMPILQHAEASRACPDFEHPYEHCDEKAALHPQGFVIQSSYSATTSITLYPVYLCRSLKYCHEIVMETELGDSVVRYWWSKDGVHAPRLPLHTRSRDRGLTIEFANDHTSCTVRFSLAFLIELLETIHKVDKECCNRVAELGTQSAASHGRHLLQLCDRKNPVRSSRRP